jgi:chromosome segregation ATPase
VLDSQINIMLAQNSKVEGQQKDYDYQTKKRIFEIERELKDTSKSRFDLETELRALEHELGKEDEDSYANTMNITKDIEFTKLENARYTLQVHLDESLIKVKEEEIKKLETERAVVKQKLEAFAEFQNSKKEARELKEKIENANVTLELLNISVKELEDATEYLNDKKDELINSKQTAEIKNEELKKELSAKEEIAEKRLQAKLNRDKNADVKELIAH